MYYSTTCSSPVGMLTLASDGNNLTGLWIEGQKYHGNTMEGELVENKEIPVFERPRTWLDSDVAGGKPAVSDIPLAPVGGEFRQEVWKILCQIPYGSVITYGDIAKLIAEKRNRPGMSGQAVGGAVGHNPISIIIPCHRVVGSNGSLTGYAAGIDKKIQLLKLEGVDMSSLFVPKKGTAI